MTSERPSPRPARVSRRDLAEAPAIWIAHGLTLALLAVCTVVLAIAIPAYEPAPLFAFAGALAVAAIWILSTRPPAMGSLPSHIALASVYVFIGAASLAYSPDWMLPFAAGGFAGTLIATRVEARRDIAAHLAAATACLVAPAIVAGASGAAWVGVFSITAAMWALCGCCVVLFDAAEHQGRELEARLRLDLLTGVGNQRLLAERLAAELTEHARIRRPMAVLALDLSDFTELNEQLGRTAGDDVLARAARAMRDVLPAAATLTRPIDDEFWALLPGTDALEAQGAIERLRDALARIDTGIDDMPGLSAAFGVAAYPRDAVTGDRLLDLAHERMASDRQVGGPSPAAASGTRSLAEDAASVLAVREQDAAIRGISRHDLARSTGLWGFAGLIYLIGALLVGLTTVLSDDAIVWRSAALTALLAVGAVVLVVPRPPAMRELRNHLYLGLLSVTAAAAFLALQPDTGIALATGMFVAPVIAIRTEERRVTFLHLAAASGLFAAAGAAGIITGDLTRATVLELAMLVPSVWSLGVSCMAALEVSDAQGRQLEELVRTDQVTGVGNRLMMSELLERELAVHRRTGAPLSVIVLELVEMFENSRGATEQLLRGAAEALEQALGPDDTVIRRRGHEFVLILPNASAPEVDHAASAVFASLSGLDGQGHRIECLHAAATFPDDGQTAVEVLAVADARLMNAGAPIAFRRHLGST